MLRWVCVLWPAATMPCLRSSETNSQSRDANAAVCLCYLACDQDALLRSSETGLKSENADAAVALCPLACNRSAPFQEF